MQLSAADLATVADVDLAFTEGELEESTVTCCRGDGECRTLLDHDCDAWAVEVPAQELADPGVGMETGSIDLPPHSRDRSGAVLVYVVECDDPQTDLFGRPIRTCILNPIRGCQLHVDQIIKADWPVWPRDTPDYLRPFAQDPHADAIFVVTFRDGVVFGEEEVNACEAN